MARSDPVTFPRWRRLVIHLRGHALLFDQKPTPRYNEPAGIGLLFIVVVLEVVRLGVLRWFYPAVPLLILVPLLLGFTLLLVRFVAGVRVSQIGFHPRQRWAEHPEQHFF